MSGCSVGKYELQVGKKGSQVGKIRAQVGKITVQVGIDIFFDPERKRSFFRFTKLDITRLNKLL